MRRPGTSMRALGLGVACALALAGTPAAARTQGVDPILVRGRRADVLVHAPAARDSAADAARLAHLVAGCRLAMEILPADSADFVSRPAPPFPLDVWQVRDAIVLVVLPVADRLVDCDDPRAQAALAPVRGLRVTLDTTYTDSRDIGEVIVRRGDQVLRPMVVERHAVRRLGAGGFRTPRDAYLRLAFDRATLDPGPTGVSDDLSVEVRSPSGEVGERIALPWVAVRIAWESSLAARPALGATLAAPVALRAPADPRLGALHAAYGAGEQERVLQLAVPQFLGAPTNGTVRREARLHATLALLALGDTASARVVGATLLQDAPCLTFDAAAAEGARTVLAGLRRPVARCEAQSTRRTLLRGALLPGFARPGTGARMDTRLLVTLGAVGATAAAVRLHAIAHERYDSYLAYQARVVGPNEMNRDVQKLHREAERARHASVTFGTAGTAIWVGQGLLALRRERAFAAQLAAVQDLGRARVVRLAPSAGPSALGLTLSYTW